MKFLKEICLFIVVCFVTCFLTKMILAGFKFETKLLEDALFITIGASLGWGIVRFIQLKKEEKKK